MGLSCFCTWVSLPFKKQEKKKMNTKVAWRRRRFLPICFPLSHSSMEERREKKIQTEGNTPFPCEAPGTWQGWQAGPRSPSLPGSRPPAQALPQDAADAPMMRPRASQPGGMQPPKFPGLVGRPGAGELEKGLCKIRLFSTQKRQELGDQHLLAKGCLFTAV